MFQRDCLPQVDFTMVVENKSGRGKSSEENMFILSAKRIGEDFLISR
jgi:hypothetical protein